MQHQPVVNQTSCFFHKLLPNRNGFIVTLRLLFSERISGSVRNMGYFCQFDRWDGTFRPCDLIMIMAAPSPARGNQSGHVLACFHPFVNRQGSLIAPKRNFCQSWSLRERPSLTKVEW